VHLAGLLEVTLAHGEQHELVLTVTYSGQAR
jgi:hypothetical protein